MELVEEGRREQAQKHQQGDGLTETAGALSAPASLHQQENSGPSEVARGWGVESLLQGGSSGPGRPILRAGQPQLQLRCSLALSLSVPCLPLPA